MKLKNIYNIKSKVINFSPRKLKVFKSFGVIFCKTYFSFMSPASRDLFAFLFTLCTCSLLIDCI